MSDVKRLTLGAPVTDRPEVDLWGRVFTLRPVTRSVQRALDSLEDKLDGVTDSDKAVEIIADGLDALLAPSGGQRTPAKKLVVDKWHADELALEQLQAFFEELQEAGRPT